MAVASMAATPTHPPPRCHRQAGGRALGVLAAATTLTGNLLQDCCVSAGSWRSIVIVMKV